MQTLPCPHSNIITPIITQSLHSHGHEDSACANEDFEDVCNVWVDEAGHVCKFVGLIKDIVARDQSEGQSTTDWMIIDISIFISVGQKQ